MDISKLNLQEELKSFEYIKIHEINSHLKASESYVLVDFTYTNEVWSGWIPYIYRRTGLYIETLDELVSYLKDKYIQFKKENRDKWYQQEKKLWDSEYASKTVTKPYFDAMVRGNWACRKCTDKITKSSNNARRIQDIKEMGYTLATNTRMFCISCDMNTTHDLLLPIDKSEPTGYETWSTALREKILTTLNYYDAYEGKKMPKTSHLIPDHKFSEIRWDSNTKEENSDSMTGNEIKAKFQLLSNQRNQQKREICRACFNTGVRGTVFGIDYYYKGTKNWDDSIPKTGKIAENGCIGCGWYDFDAWRESLNSLLTENRTQKGEL